MSSNIWGVSLLKNFIMTNYEIIYNQLPENEQHSLIEKVMPFSGTFRQHDSRGFWSEDQWKSIYEAFFKSIQWDRGELLDTVSYHVKGYTISGTSELGNIYEGIGIYDDGELVEIEDVELIQN